MRLFLFVSTLLVFCCLASAQPPKVKVVAHPERHEVTIAVDNRPFTTYLFADTLRKPILYPVRAASGTIVTRGFPIHPRPGESADHPHQVGLWFSYESVNGLDFWNNSYAIPVEERSHYGWIRHQKILSIKSGDTGVLKIAADWENQKGDILIKEITTFTFSGADHQRTLDRVTTLAAVVPVRFKDIKDGLLGIRVAKGLQLPAGNYLTSKGKTGDSAWGTRARWCMLYGKLKQEKTSIVIFDHPDNPGYPTYWHARGYGLFAANPLGQKIFSDGKQVLNLRLSPGQSVTFRYRIVIRNGTYPTTDRLNKEADAFAIQY